MWMIIICALLAGAALSVIYLASRFAKFFVIFESIREKKKIRFAAGLVLVIVILFVAGAALGAINAAILILHLTVFWFICDAVGKLLEKKRGGEFKRYYTGMCAVGVTAAYLACGWYLSHHVWRTEYDISTDKPVGSLRVVLFADAHVGNTFDGEGLLARIKDIQEEQPDLVAVAGDFVDDDTSKEDMAAACRALGALKTTYGVYYVFGNHDKGYYGSEYRGYGADDLVAELEKNNVRVLEDETVLLDGRFCVIGRQDRSAGRTGEERASMEELTAGLDPHLYSIVLDHQPHDYDAQEAAGVDLVLSGHTHGGQLFPFHRMGEWLGIDAKSYGQEKRGNTNFVVTSGISDWAIQFKTGCKSEYVVVDVRQEGF